MIKLNKMVMWIVHVIYNVSAFLRGEVSVVTARVNRRLTVCTVRSTASKKKCNMVQHQTILKLVTLLGFSSS